MAINLNRWLSKYSKSLLPMRIFEQESQVILNVISEESRYFDQQRQSLKEDFSDYFSTFNAYLEEQNAITLAQKKKTLSRIYRKSESQLRSLAHKQNLSQNQQNNDSDNDYSLPYTHKPTFTTRYLESVDGRQYLIIGTYHTLQECSVEVMNLFKEFDPDCAVLELCSDRYYQLNDAKINQKTQPHRVYNDLEKDPEDLQFLLKSSEFQVAYEAAQRSKKGCQILPADLKLYYIQNRSKYLRAQCTCNVRQIRDKNSPMKQVLSYFFFGLIPYIARRLLGYKIDVNEQIIKMEKYLESESRHCITNVVYYEREYNILNSLCNLSQGQRVFTIVGFSHLNQLYEMLLKREEILKSTIKNNDIGIDLFQLNENSFFEQSYEQLIKRNQLLDELYTSIDYTSREYERQQYCAKLE